MVYYIEFPIRIGGSLNEIHAFPNEIHGFPMPPMPPWPRCGGLGMGWGGVAELLMRILPRWIYDIGCLFIDGSRNR